MLKLLTITVLLLLGAGCTEKPKESDVIEEPLFFLYDKFQGWNKPHTEYVTCEVISQEGLLYIKRTEGRQMEGKSFFVQPEGLDLSFRPDARRYRDILDLWCNQ